MCPPCWSRIVRKFCSRASVRLCRLSEERKCCQQIHSSQGDFHRTCPVLPGPKGFAGPNLSIWRKNSSANPSSFVSAKPRPSVIKSPRRLNSQSTRISEPSLCQSGIVGVIVERPKATGKRIAIPIHRLPEILFTKTQQRPAMVSGNQVGGCQHALRFFGKPSC